MSEAPRGRFSPRSHWLTSPVARDLGTTFDGFAEGRFLIGDVEQIMHGILRCAEIARTDHILLRMQGRAWSTARRSAASNWVGSIIAALR